MTSSPTLAQCHAQPANNYNLIRLLAALAVIYGHATAITGGGPPDLWLQLVGFKFIGGVAVDMFFVISGFLVTASACSERGLRYYTASRLLRIYPALVLCMALTTLVLGPLLSTDPAYWHQAQTWRYLVGNASALSTEYFLPGVFETLHDHGVNGSIWSLAVEVRLYVVVLVLALTRILRVRALSNLIGIGALATGFLLPDLWARFIPFANWRVTSTMFLLGALAWVNRDRITLNPGMLLVLLFFAASLRGTDGFVLGYTLLLPYLVFWLAYAPGFGWFNRFGDYSYGVYLYGWPSEQLVMLARPGIDNAHLTLYACGLSLLFAALSWHLVEHPALALRRRLARPGGAVQGVP